VVSVLLWFVDSDYSFCIYSLFLEPLYQEAKKLDAFLFIWDVNQSNLIIKLWLRMIVLLNTENLSSMVCTITMKNILDLIFKFDNF
jgi:hypothetical protein